MFWRLLFSSRAALVADRLTGVHQRVHDYMTAEHGGAMIHVFQIRAPWLHCMRRQYRVAVTTVDRSNQQYGFEPKMSTTYYRVCGWCGKTTYAVLRGWL